MNSQNQNLKSKKSQNQDKNSPSLQVPDGTIRLQHSNLLDCNWLIQFATQTLEFSVKVSVAFGIVGPDRVSVNSSALRVTFCENGGYYHRSYRIKIKNLTVADLKRPCTKVF